MNPTRLSRPARLLLVVLLALPGVALHAQEGTYAPAAVHTVLILKDDNRITGVVFLDAGTKL